MSIQLRTLKDFEREHPAYDRLTCVMTVDLKQEAIKWIRMNDEMSFGSQKETVEEWIKLFFNITPEDLKSEKE